VFARLSYNEAPVGANLCVRPSFLQRSSCRGEPMCSPVFQPTPNSQEPATQMINHQHYIQQALTLAQKAQQNGEVPIGALIVKNNKIIGEGYNQPITTQDPTAHAEIIAIRNAAQTTKNYRLPDTTLYVTLEPCLMCLGAIIHARIPQIVYGAHDPKIGVFSTQQDITKHQGLNHKIKHTGGILEQQCKEQLKHFFQQRRAQQKEEPPQ